MAKIIEFTDNNSNPAQTAWILSYSTGFDPAYTYTKSSAQQWTDNEVDAVIAEIRGVDSNVDFGNPNSTPPSPF